MSVSFSSSATRQSRVPEDKVEADDRFGLRRLAVVKNGGLSCCPHESATVGQETVVAGADLTFGQHCTQQMKDQHSNFFGSSSMLPCSLTSPSDARPLRTYTCADSCPCGPSRARDETGALIGQSDRRVCNPPALSAWRRQDGRKHVETLFL